MTDAQTTGTDSRRFDTSKVTVLVRPVREFRHPTPESTRRTLSGACTGVSGKEASFR